MVCEWMKVNYRKRYCEQALEVTEDVADRNQGGLMEWRKIRRNGVVEIGGRLPRIEDAGDICLRRPRPTQGYRADDDDSGNFCVWCAGLQARSRYVSECFWNLPTQCRFYWCRLS